MRKPSSKMRANRKTEANAKAKNRPALTKHFVSLAGSIEPDSYREEVFNGTDYVVVPVVALVEGVLQGMNAPAPEFAPSAAFGKFPEGWNGRPLVMNHPVNDDGVPISANSTAALESNGFGLIFNTLMEDGKLKTEAWIDVATATAKGGEFLSTLERVKNGEMVEVSTGCFVTTMQKKGAFNGRAYESVWIEVVPDHLALLSEGVKGACSIEDGCGTPRSNKDKAMPKTPPKKPVKGKNKKDDEDEDEVVANIENHECGCGGHGDTCTCHEHDSTPQVQKLTAQQESERSEVIEAESARVEVLRKLFDVQSVPDTLLSRDVEKAVSRALKDLHAGRDVYCYLIGYTANSAVYEMIDWDKPSGSWDIFQIPMDVDADGKVTFNGEPKEVNLLTRIVSVNQKVENDMPTKQPKAAGQSTQPEAEDDEAAVTTTETPAPAAGDPPANTPEVKEPAANANAPKDSKEPKALTAAEYIASAPPEIREVLQESQRVHTDKKNGIIKALKDSKRCEFSDEELKAMSIPQLEKLLKLADVPSYEAIALPGRTDNLVGNAGQNDQWAAPVPLSCYEAPAPQAQQ